MPESPWVSFLPILRCPGLPYTKYGCAGASRLGKKIQPKARRSFPILRCPGLPYTKYGCAGASRLGKKSSPRHGARFPYFVAPACHTHSTAVPLRHVLAKNPSQIGVCPPILRCPGLPYTKYGCAGAPPVFYRAVSLSIAPPLSFRGAKRRGNPQSFSCKSTKMRN